MLHRPECLILELREPPGALVMCALAPQAHVLNWVKNPVPEVPLAFVVVGRYQLLNTYFVQEQAYFASFSSPDKPGRQDHNPLILLVNRDGGKGRACECGPTQTPSTFHRAPCPAGARLPGNGQTELKPQVPEA